MNIILKKEMEQFKNINSDSKKQEIFLHIKDILKKKKIIIYGAGAIGKTLADIMLQLGIEISFFADRRYEDIGQIDGIPVVSPDKLENHTLVIVAVDSVLFLEFRKEIENNIETYAPESEVIPGGRDLTLLLKSALCKKRLLDGENFHLTDCINCGAENRECETFEKYLKEISLESKLDKASFSMKYNKFFGYILGNVCTLKCKHCCEMVPYYDKYGFVKKEQVIEDCRRMAEASQFTRYIELIGGEPFLHPDIVFILEELLKLEDVGYIKVFTNGTVVPGKELYAVLKNPRIVLVWSNYLNTVGGRLLENIQKTRRMLEKEQINYIYSNSKTWLDFSSFDYVEKSEDELSKDFDDCFIANCHRLYQGVMYRCPHQYAAARLGKVTVGKEDCIVMEDFPTPKELSEKLYQFKNMPYVEACRYCVVPYKAEEVPAGEQLSASQTGE